MSTPRPHEEPAELTLAAGFPAPERAEWERLVDAVLQKARRVRADAPPGAGVAELVHTTADGIAVAPLYTAADTQPGPRPPVRAPGGWDVRQRHGGAAGDTAAVNTAILADLDGGVTSIWLAVGPGAVPVADLPRALDGVLLDLAPVVLDAGTTADEAAEAFLALAADRGVADPELLGNLGLDPIGLRARTGSGPDPDSVVPLAARVAERYPQLRAIVVDALPVHTAGGSDAQELGYALSAGVAYLRALVAAGIGVETAARLVELRFAATERQFPTIAKLRAARRLWARVLEASGAPAGATSAQHAVSSPTMLTQRDPYVNLLRGTVAGFAAGVGGADAVTVAPFDAAIGVPTPFSERIARNTQALLMAEAHLARVSDPAAGSWFVESLTDELARAGWEFFQELEAAGGAVAALDSGLLDERIAAVRAVREHEVATRARPVTGVSEFPDLAEKPVEREPVAVPAATGGLPVYRPAAAFEEFRDRSDAVLAATGARPSAFLATLGPLPTHAARAGFVRNLLQAGGIQPVDAGPTASVDEVVTAYRAAPTPVVVLCGSDDLYAERAVATAEALRAAGATTVLLAGRTRDAAISAAVDGTLVAGGDALTEIATMYAALEVPA